MVTADISTLEEYPPIRPADLVLGLVYGAGAETDTFQTTLAENLQHYGYKLRTVHVSNYFPAVVSSTEFARERPQAMRDLQDMGDKLRRETERNDAAALLGMYLMAAKRRRSATDERTGWLLRSLKRPEEIELLRRIYGPRFTSLSLHVPEVVRRRNTERRWQRWAPQTSLRYEEEATRDIRRDEEDRSVEYGQAVRDTFAAADFIVDGRSQSRLQASIARVVRLMFGEPFEPPLRDEQAMFHAFAAGLRSSEMGRQVGAAIVDQDGDLLVVGTNDVPTGRGGLYWSPEEPDHRDFAEEPPLDSNTLWQRRISRELLVQMAETGWLRSAKITKLENDAFDVSEEQLDGFLHAVKPTRFRAITEFGRAVHSEMDALTTAARRGTSVTGATLVCTTFPCHNCTRHIIASGIRKILYVLPYSKSLARELHGDALVIEPETDDLVDGKVVLDQYTGVAPRVFAQYFHFGQSDRKDKQGRAMKLDDRRAAVPRALESGGGFAFGGPTLPVSRILELEATELRQFEARIKKTPGLDLPTPTEEEDEH
jgi:deoxycytidylate deaminase